MERINSNAVSQLKAWIAAHREKLLESKIVTIIATYCGEGDEGWLDYVDFLTDDGNLAKAFKPETLWALFEALHEELAPEGYGNNDGGGGEFSLNVATGKLTHESYFLCTERSYNDLEEY
jgi:hypothetical protein